MIFEKLADGIMKRSKLIIAIWVVALVCSAPFIMKAMDKLSYDMGGMSDDKSESLEGARIIGANFDNSGDNPLEVGILVITFQNTEGGKAAAAALAEELRSRSSEYKDKNGVSKLSGAVPYGMYEKDGKGMQLVAFMYTPAMHSKASDDTQNLRDWIAGMAVSGEIQTYLTGSPAINYDMMKGAAHDISYIDVFSVGLILILVGLFFRSIFASAMPPVTIGVAIGLAFCALFFVGEFMDVFFITQMFIIVSMLGAGCDYCIFIIARYKEERRKGADHPAAMKDAIMWAGESITTSGLAVMIGFGSMYICSFSVISGMGMMLAIGIAIALLAALTLITSILNLLGEKMFWPSKIESFREGSKSMKGWYGKFSRLGDKYFHVSVKFSIKHAKAIVIAAVLITVPAAYVMMTSPSSYDMMGTMMTGDSKKGLDSVEEYTNGGMMMPTYEVVEFANPVASVTWLPGKIPQLRWDSNGNYALANSLSGRIAASDAENIGAVSSLVKWQELASMTMAGGVVKNPGESDNDYLLRLFTDPAKGLLVNPDMPQSMKMTLSQLYGETVKMAARQSLAWDSPLYCGMADYVLNYKTGSLGGIKGGSEMLLTHVKYTVLTKDQAMSDRSIDSLHKVKDAVGAFGKDNPGVLKATWLTGTAAVMFEISEEVNKEFLKVIVLAMVLIFFLLLFVLKSYFTPLRSIATIMMSVVWTVAITHLIFGSLMGAGVVWMVPIILIVICLGLGMDYDILLTTRIKENHLHRGMSNDEAITEAVVSSGSVITICGLIMGGAFGTLMLSGMVLLKEFGFALCFAILVDALLVRTYLVPALMHLMGEWCWKGPKFMHRKLRKTE